MKRINAVKKDEWVSEGCCSLKAANLWQKTKGQWENIRCQRPSAPGKITQRSCVFYGARWMLAPLKDAIHLVHGPVGCAQYGSTVRGQSYRIFSTALEEKDIIFGGINKLIKSLLEVRRLEPQAKYIFVYLTCTPSLIGDDAYWVCKHISKRLGCPVIMVDCPGFKGESQAKGHKIAYECLFKELIGKGERKSGPYDVNIIGDYNINGESQVLKALLKRMGIHVHCVFTGDAPYEKIISAHKVRLNLLICQNTGQNLAKAMEKKYGIPYLKVSFFGLSQTIESLKKIGQFFGLKKEAEGLIAEEYKAIKPKLNWLLPKLKGKKAALFFGAARMATLLRALDDLGMEVVFTGSQFGNKDTYKEAWQYAKPGTYIIDDASEHDLDHLLRELKPDVFMGGTKENFLSHKLRVGFCLFPQPKICGPYVGFQGFVNFAYSVYQAVYAPVWRWLRAD